MEPPIAEMPARRDRLLLLVAFAEALLTLLGAAAESLGLDRMLKVNLSRSGRTRSVGRARSGTAPSLRCARNAYF